MIARVAHIQLTFTIARRQAADTLKLALFTPMLPKLVLECWHHAVGVGQCKGRYAVRLSDKELTVTNAQVSGCNQLAITMAKPAEFGIIVEEGRKGGRLRPRAADNITASVARKDL